MSESWWAEPNGRLLLNLFREYRAKELGSISNFFETPPEWHCPSCFRSKPEIARLDKNGNLLCSTHRHHDHFGDLAGSRLPRLRDDWRALEAFRDGFVRFSPTLICSDCNVAEVAAKAAAGAVSQFSFTPFEISMFIFVEPNAPHRVDHNIAIDLYEVAKGAMSPYGRALKRAIQCMENDSFEHLGGAAWRVLKKAREKMKDSKP